MKYSENPAWDFKFIFYFDADDIRQVPDLFVINPNGQWSQYPVLTATGRSWFKNHCGNLETQSRRCVSGKNFAIFFEHNQIAVVHFRLKADAATFKLAWWAGV